MSSRPPGSEAASHYERSGNSAASLVERVMTALDIGGVAAAFSSASALQIATALAADPAVTAVHHPGLPGDPWHGAAAAQFSTGFSGMLSFQTGAAAARAIAVCGATRLFRRATSLGSTESLIEHRLTTEGPTPPVQRN